MRSFLALVIFAASAAAADAPSGEQLFRKNCEGCHSGNGGKVPSLQVLAKKGAGSIRKTLETGVMRQQGATMTPAERRAVSSWIASGKHRK